MAKVRLKACPKCGCQAKTNPGFDQSHNQQHVMSHGCYHRSPLLVGIALAAKLADDIKNCWFTCGGCGLKFFRI